MFFTPADSPLRVDISSIGMQLLNVNQYGYVLPFEVVSILLLAAMIGCIVIAIKTPVGEKLNGQGSKISIREDKSAEIESELESENISTEST